MLERVKWASDGRCFAKLVEGCAVLCMQEKGCGTYRCKFYKPKDCKDWVRLNDGVTVRLYAPEEYVKRGETKC